MRQTIIMIICTTIVLVGGICEIKYLNKSSVYVRSDMEYIKNAIENGNFESAAGQVKATYNNWQNMKRVWNIFINHDEIDDIDDAMIDLIKHLEYKNDEECLVAIEKIKRGLEHTVRRQELRIDNIL